MTARVRVTRQTRSQIRTIDAWWRENRPAAPDLFSQELAAAFVALRDAPRIGSPYDHPGTPGLRRVLLRATRFHLYYVVADAEVVVVAAWSCLRAGGPRL